EIFLEGWSADSSYIAYINTTEGSDDPTMFFVHVPDLKIRTPGVLIGRFDGGCTGPESINTPLHCHPHAPKSHRPAFIFPPHGFDQLNVVDIDQVGPARFWLPTSDIRTVQISPSGDCVAVASFIWPTDESPPAPDGSLSIYCLNGFRRVVDNVEFVGIGA